MDERVERALSSCDGKVDEDDVLALIDAYEAVVRERDEAMADRDARAKVAFAEAGITADLRARVERAEAALAAAEAGAAGMRADIEEAARRYDEQSGVGNQCSHALRARLHATDTGAALVAEMEALRARVADLEHSTRMQSATITQHANTIEHERKAAAESCAAERAHAHRLFTERSEALVQAERDAKRADANAAECSRLTARVVRLKYALTQFALDVDGTLNGAPEYVRSALAEDGGAR